MCPSNLKDAEVQISVTLLRDALLLNHSLIVCVFLSKAEVHFIDFSLQYQHVAHFFKICLHSMTSPLLAVGQLSVILLTKT